MQLQLQVPLRQLTRAPTSMIIETAATLGGVWALPRLFHMGVVEGLPAPRVPFARMPNAFGRPPDRVHEVHITIGGKRLIE